MNINNIAIILIKITEPFNSSFNIFGAKILINVAYNKTKNGWIDCNATTRDTKPTDKAIIEIKPPNIESISLIVRNSTAFLRLCKMAIKS